MSCTARGYELDFFGKGVATCIDVEGNVLFPEYTSVTSSYSTVENLPSTGLVNDDGDRE